MRADCDSVVGCGRDPTPVRANRMWMLNRPHPRVRQRTPDAKPIVIQVPGDEDAIVRTPVDDILTVSDSERSEYHPGRRSVLPAH
jgi:hypothetical protein